MHSSSGSGTQQSSPSAAPSLSTAAVFRVKWGPEYVPYPLLQATCGDMVVFAWAGAQLQTVAIARPYGGHTFRVPQDCRSAAAPLTPAVGSGEHAEELLSPGLIFFAEPTNCRVGQVLAVNVSCGASSARKSRSAQFATAAPVDVGAIMGAIAPKPAPAPGPAASAAQPAPALGPAATAAQSAPALGPAASDAQPAPEPGPTPGTVATASAMAARVGAFVHATAVAPAPAQARHVAAPETAVAPAPTAAKHAPSPAPATAQHAAAPTPAGGKNAPALASGLGVLQLGASGP